MDAGADDLILAADREKCYANLYSVFFLPLTSAQDFVRRGDGTGRHKKRFYFETVIRKLTD